MYASKYQERECKKAAKAAVRKAKQIIGTALWADPMFEDEPDHERIKSIASSRFHDFGLKTVEELLELSRLIKSIVDQQ